MGRYNLDKCNARGYTEENIDLHRGQHANPGSKNGNAIYTDEEVFEMRKYYVNHSLREVYEKYGSKSKSKEGLRGIIDRSYQHIPMYLKKNKCWTLNGEPIDINNYNPVSTISGSGE